jgi:hypothetical protein
MLQVGRSEESSLSRLVAWAGLVLGMVGCSGRTREDLVKTEREPLPVLATMPLPLTSEPPQGVEGDVPQLPVNAAESVSKRDLRLALRGWDGRLPSLQDLDLGEPSPRRMELLTNPPTAIPGAAKVEHVINPDRPAGRVIVIRDFHGSGLADEIIAHLAESGSKGSRLSPEELQRIRESHARQRDEVQVVQGHIATILSHLANTWGIREVYREATSVENIKDDIELLDLAKTAEGQRLLMLATEKVAAAWVAHGQAYQLLESG